MLASFSSFNTAIGWRNSNLHALRATLAKTRFSLWHELNTRQMKCNVQQQLTVYRNSYTETHIRKRIRPVVHIGGHVLE